MYLSSLYDHYAPSPPSIPFASPRHLAASIKLCHHLSFPARTLRPVCPAPYPISTPSCYQPCSPFPTTRIFSADGSLTVRPGFAIPRV